MSLGRATIKRIRRIARRIENASDDELRNRGLSLKYRVSTGTKLDLVIPDAFALVLEAVRRSTGKVLYDVQLWAGIQLALCRAAEMKTGEGKTLTATLPAYIHALAGLGAHVVTVNDYLAQRDFELMGPIYERLGLSVGSVTSDDSPEQRQQAYRKDITYGTAKEFGFDFLRDRMKSSQVDSSLSNRSQLVQRGLHFVLVDEADSVLIDEARTPLIIGIIDSEEEERKADCFRWAARHGAEFLEGTHFEYEHDKQKVKLLSSGIKAVRRLPQTAMTRTFPIRRLYEYIENAIKVRRDFHLDQHYVVREGEIAIVDEFTGRIAEGRQWQGGIHQSIEAKENLEITPATRQGATVTLQTFFRRYKLFAGMSGTLLTSSREFKKVYRKKVVSIPTHRPIQRIKLPTRVFGDWKAKMDAVIQESLQVAEIGRAVLIGTRSVEKSLWISDAFSKQNVDHKVLNANHDEEEADIVAQSGQPGRITVATNMAGRGTDIMLADEVRKLGGLHVILTELHESQRIDWQLIGRGSRQGDPGSFRIFVAMDDEILLSGLGPAKAKALRSRYSRSLNRSLPMGLFRHFLKAQQQIEKKHLVDRMILMRQDKERQERQFEMGLDPFCEVVHS
ncbi:MAG: DEAD/DEAH box helicase [Planctomycetota bacterium]